MLQGPDLRFSLSVLYYISQLVKWGACLETIAYLCARLGYLSPDDSVSANRRYYTVVQWPVSLPVRKALTSYFGATKVGGRVELHLPPPQCSALRCRT
jgi:hypothetical protein